MENLNNNSNYVLAKKICDECFKLLKDNIFNDNIRDIKYLCNLADEYIKSKAKLAFPTCISKNDCVGYFVSETKMAGYNVIVPGDVIKIEYAVRTSEDCVVSFGETILYKCENEEYKKIVQTLNYIKNNIQTICKIDNLNDDIRYFIQTHCAENGCYPIRNCKSLQQGIGGTLNDENSKYIILNYLQHYDINDNAMVEENLALPIENGDIYHMNIRVIPERSDPCTLVTSHEPHIYRLNGKKYGFKLRSTRSLYNTLRKNHNFDCFRIGDYYNDARSKLGFNEMIKNQVLDQYTVYYNREKIPCFIKNFTIVINENQCYIF